MNFFLRVLFLICALTQLTRAQWMPQSSVTTADLYDIKFVGHSSGWIVGNGVILKTTDAGATWTTLIFPGKIFDECSFPNARQGWVVGATSFSSGNGLIAQTTNGGESWTVRDSSQANTYWDAVYFVDSLHGWVAGGPSNFSDTSGAILKTVDGGISWVNITTFSFQYLRDIFFLDTLNGWACAEFGAIYHSTDGGSTWSLSTRAASVLRQIYFVNGDSGWAVGGISGEELIVRTTDGGVTWQSRLITFGGSSLQGVWFTDSQMGWAVGGHNHGTKILHTSDGGASWDEQQNGLQTNSILLTSVCMIDSSGGWIVGEQGTILKTDNGGVTDVADDVTSIPREIHLAQNYPNPFNGSTTIEFSLTKGQTVRLSVCDITGREVAVLHNGITYPGTRALHFDAAGLASGTYYYRLDTRDLRVTRSLLLMK